MIRQTISNYRTADDAARGNRRGLHGVLVLPEAGMLVQGAYFTRRRISASRRP